MGAEDEEIGQARGELSRRAVAITLGVAGLIRLPLLARPLTASHADSWRQIDTASIAHHFYVGGYDLLCPQVYWGGSGPGYAEAEFQLQPFLTALLYANFGESVWLGRLVSLIFAMLGLWFFCLLVHRVVGARAAIFSLAFLAFTPLHLRYSTAFMPEATASCFCVAALFYFQCWLDEQAKRFLWRAGVATALAILVKPTAALLGPIFFLLLFRRERWRFLLRAEVWAFALISSLPGLAWYWHARELYFEHGNSLGILFGGDSKLGGNEDALSRASYRDVFDLEWTFVQAGVLFFMGAAWVCWKKKLSGLPLFGVMTAVFSYLAVARYAPESSGLQDHVFFLPFAALVVGVALAWIRWSANAVAASAGVVLIATALNVTKSYLSLFDRSHEEFATCGEQVRQLTPSDALVVVGTLPEAVDRGERNYHQERAIFFFAERHGWSLPTDRHSPQKVEQLRREGASYFVASSDALVKERPELLAYLGKEAQALGPGLASSCGIYRFNEPRGPAMPEEPEAAAVLAVSSPVLPRPARSFRAWYSRGGR